PAVRTSFYLLSMRLPPRPTLFPYTTLFRSNETVERPLYEYRAILLSAYLPYIPWKATRLANFEPHKKPRQHHFQRLSPLFHQCPTYRLPCACLQLQVCRSGEKPLAPLDRKSTRLNSSHVKTSYAVF